MKHYFSFLLLSLFIFLSLVCSSPVMAQCTSTLTIQCEDYVDYTTQPGGSNDSRPSKIISNSYTGYGTPEGGSFADYQDSNGEMWIPVTLPAGTFTFTIRYAKGDNVWFNLYSVSSGSKIGSKGIGAKGDSFDTSNSDSYALSAGNYVIGLYSGGQYTAFDQIVITATSDVFCESSCPAQDQRTITFAGNGNTGGSMSNVTAICSGDNRTLPANGFTNTGYTFTGWIANVDVKINGATVTAGTLIADGATIQDITQNITLTAQWARKTTITLDPNTANHGATGSSVTAIWGTALPKFAPTTGESGYVLTGYFTDPIGGTKIINADGTLVASTSYTTADSKWNSEQSTLTLYPQYKSSIGPKTVPCTLNFIYTQSDGNKKITDSDFSYSCNTDAAKKINEKVGFSGSGSYTLTSRMDVIFPQTGTYTFTFHLYLTENGSYDAPRVTVNGQQSAAATLSNGPGDQDYVTTLTVTAGTYTVEVWIGNTNEKVLFSTMDITSDQSGNIVSALPWDGSQDLTEGTTVSAQAISSCFDSEITFTFEGTGTVNYYDNTNRSSSLGTVTSGQPIELNDDLREHGIYIECTSGAATLTEVSKTTKGAVYKIWSGNVAVRDWKQQVVLGPEHFQTAIVGDVLRVNTSAEGGGAQGALQYIYTAQDGTHTYKGLDNSTGSGLRDWTLSDTEKGRHYFEIQIDATHLANLQRYGVIVKGNDYTIQSVELRASCANKTMRTTAPDVTLYGEDGTIDIMARKLELEGKGKGFCLGNWEHKLELDENCFKKVTVGSLINFYMQVQEGATISFRCNVASIEAKSYDDKIPFCPSYGDISFDRTIDNLYGDEPKLIGNNDGYRVLYLLVDADMLRRLNETGMIICGKGACIKAVEAVPNPFVINAGEEKEVPTVVTNLEIHQGGSASNDDDIEVLDSITYIRPAQGGYLNNQLDTWYTFTVPFTVNGVEVYDETDKEWYDINAVYYKNDGTDQDANNPDGAGHYYLQYLSKQNIATDREAFITRWQYITPGHSLACVSEWEDNNGTRYGYPKKNEAYIILFDREQPSELAGYWKSNPEIRFVGGPQTIEGIAKTWKVPSDGKEYWMYANNTLHSFTLSSAYILNEEGTYFILQSNPIIRPFECYVQATESLKTRYAALPMRGSHIDNTPTGMESMQGSAIRVEKILRNGQLIIIRNGVEYDATGAVIR